MKASDTVLGVAFLALAVVGVIYFIRDAGIDSNTVPWILGVGIVPMIIGMTLIKMGRKK